MKQSFWFLGKFFLFMALFSALVYPVVIPYLKFLTGFTSTLVKFSLGYKFSEASVGGAYLPPSEAGTETAGSFSARYYMHFRYGPAEWNKDWHPNGIYNWFNLSSFLAIMASTRGILIKRRVKLMIYGAAILTVVQAISLALMAPIVISFGRVGEQQSMEILAAVNASSSFLLWAVLCRNELMSGLRDLTRA